MTLQLVRSPFPIKVFQLPSYRSRQRFPLSLSSRPMAIASVWLGLLMLSGCNHGPSLPPRAAVTGTVRLDGQPLPRGEVMFIPDTQRGTTGPSAAGTITSDGHYELTTDHAGQGGDGAMVGFHRVRVQSRSSSEPGAPSRPLIPMRYANADTSGLEYEVKAGTDNRIDIDLVSR